MIPIAITSDLAAILESLGMGTWNGGGANATIATNHEPDLPAVCTTLYATGGPQDTQTYDGDTYGERPAQVRMRDLDPVALETRMEALYALWTAWQTYGAYFVTVKAATKPLYNYPTQDSNQGTLYIASFNVRVIKGS